MKTITSPALIASLIAALAAGCGESDAGDDPGDAGGADEGAGAASPADSTSSDVGDDIVRVVNGCTRTRARDHRGQAAVTIRFPAPSGAFRYSPACLRVSAGTKVTWEGSFALHPLQAGRVNRVTHVATVSTTSPIHERATGQQATFTMLRTGTFGYFCEHHYMSGMYGAVYVE